VSSTLDRGCFKYYVFRYSLSYASLPIRFHTNKGANSGHTRASVLCFTIHEDSPFKQILTAELAFHKGPTFDKLAPGQPSREEIVQWGLSEGQEGHVKRLSNSLHVANHERTNAGISREEAATF